MVERLLLCAFQGQGGPLPSLRLLTYSRSIRMIFPDVSECFSLPNTVLKLPIRCRELPKRFLRGVAKRAPVVFTAVMERFPETELEICRYRFEPRLLAWPVRINSRAVSSVTDASRPGGQFRAFELQTFREHEPKIQGADSPPFSNFNPRR